MILLPKPGKADPKILMMKPPPPVDKSPDYGEDVPICALRILLSPEFTVSSFFFSESQISDPKIEQIIYIVFWGSPDSNVVADFRSVLYLDTKFNIFRIK